MPNIKSAKKRVLVAQKKNLRNKMVTSEMKTVIKKFNNAIDTNNIKEAEALLPVTMSTIDSAAAKGIIHKNNAANKKSALAKRLADVKSGKVVIEIKKDNKTLAAEKALAAKETRDAIKAENAKKAAARQAQKEEEAAKKAPVKKAAAKKAPVAKKAEEKTPATKKAEENTPVTNTESEDADKKPAPKKKALKKPDLKL